MKIINIFKETITDGPGFRYSIYFAGCTHQCKGCHNPSTWSSDLGREVDENYIDEIISDIKKNPLLSGVTLSGGDPFYNPAELLNFLKRLKDNLDINIWSYSGYTFEALLKDPLRKDILEYIDVLVDGKFVEELFDPTLFYRGSKNQRIVDVKKSLESKDVVTIDF